MSYDEDQAVRVRECLATERGLVEKRMFGGLAFLLGGHLAVAVSGQGGLMLRCDPADTDEHVAQPHVARMEMKGKEMDGWLRVADEAVAADDDLARWVAVGVTYAKTLPPKS